MTEYSRLIKISHLLLAAGVSTQLALSLIMKVPKPGQPIDALGGGLFNVHANVGAALFAVLAIHWLLFVAGHARLGIGHYFPWFSRARLAILIQEVKRTASIQRLPDPNDHNAAASAFEGLGLVLASLLAISGLVLYFGIASDGAMSVRTHSVKEVHETFGLVMWGYLAIHAGAAMAHRYMLGHRSILSIFNIFK